MGRCDLFGCDGNERMTYSCRRCGMTFCSEHRLPEAHNCGSVRPKSEAGEKWFKEQGSEREQEKRGEKRRRGAASTPKKPNFSNEKSQKTSERKAKNWKTVHFGDTQDGSPPVRTRSESEDTDEESGSRLGWIWTIVGVLLLVGSRVRRFINSLLAYLFQALTGLVKIGIAFGVIAFLAVGAAGVIEATGGDMGAAGIDLGGVSNESGGYVAADDLDRERIEKHVLELTNEEREKQGLDPVTYDNRLENIARGHSEDMAKNAYFSHESRIGNNFEDRYEKAGYTCRIPIGDSQYATGSENIAYTYHAENIENYGRLTNERELAEALVDSWMNSPGHRRNILTEYWENLGVGIAITEENGMTKVYATQNFC
jgi:uncharacterized protein YkwD